jgi:hypothetical protein
MRSENITEQFKSSGKDKIIKEGSREFRRFQGTGKLPIRIDYTQKEKLSAELLKIKMHYSGTAEGSDQLSRVAELVCERITYLSESFKLIELDRHNNKVQIRSAPPFRKESFIYYFEIILDLSKKTLQLQRLMYDRDIRSTEPVSFVVSYDILERLIADLVQINES